MTRWAPDQRIHIFSLGHDGRMPDMPDSADWYAIDKSRPVLERTHRRGEAIAVELTSKWPGPANVQISALDMLVRDARHDLPP
jgi:hypothetical protein